MAEVPTTGRRIPCCPFSLGNREKRARSCEGWRLTTPDALALLQKAKTNVACSLMFSPPTTADECDQLARDCQLVATLFRTRAQHIREGLAVTASAKVTP